MTVGVLQEMRSGASASSTNKAFTSNLTAGSSIHVVCYAAANPATAIVPTDTQGNTYTQRGTIQADASGHYMTHYTADGVAAGANTITVTTTGTTVSGTVFWAREIGSTSGFDTHAEHYTAGFSPGNDVVSSNTATPSVAPGLCSAVVVEVGGTSTMSAGTGLTSDTNPNTSECTEHLRYTTTAALAATGDATGGSSGNGMVFAAFFKESGGGGGGTTHFMSLMGVGS